MIGPQVAPLLSQRSHWYAYRIPDPVHVPALPVRFAPTTAVPLIVGGEVFTGAFRDFAAELPLAKRPRETASTPAVANQVFGAPTGDFSVHGRNALIGLPPPKEGRPVTRFQRLPIGPPWGLGIQVSSTNTLHERHVREGDPHYLAPREPGCTVSADAPHRHVHGACSSVVARRPDRHEAAGGIGGREGFGSKHHASVPSAPPWCGSPCSRAQTAASSSANEIARPLRGSIHRPRQAERHRTLRAEAAAAPGSAFRLSLSRLAAASTALDRHESPLPHQAQAVRGHGLPSTVGRRALQIRRLHPRLRRGI